MADDRVEGKAPCAVAPKSGLAEAAEVAPVLSEPVCTSDGAFEAVKSDERVLVQAEGSTSLVTGESCICISLWKQTD